MGGKESTPYKSQNMKNLFHTFSYMEGVDEATPWWRQPMALAASTCMEPGTTPNSTATSSEAIFP